MKAKHPTCSGLFLLPIKKEEVSHCSHGDAVKVFVKHCTTLRFLYVDAVLSR